MSETEPRLEAMNGAGLSIVIATLNEAARIGTLLAALQDDAPRAEIIVVDGGSEDGTAALATASGVRVVTTAAGRGAQLRLGGEMAGRDQVLFLHADCHWPPGGAAAIADALADPAMIGGNFRVRFDGGDFFSAWLNLTYHWLRRMIGLHYGDSGIFIRRTALAAIGGIAPLALMEDFDLTLRMRAFGRVAYLQAPRLGVSARRFAGRHPAAIIGSWALAHTLYAFRLPSRWNAVLYGGTKRAEPQPDQGSPES